MAVNSEHRLRSTLLTIVGSSLLWAWGYICYLSPAMFPDVSVTASIGIENAYFTSQAVAAIFAVAIFAVVSRRQVAVSPVVFLLAALCVCLSGVLIESVLYGNIAAIWLYVAGCLDGMGIPLLGVAWGTRYCLGTQGRMKTTPLVLTSFATAYIIYFVVYYLPPVVAATAVCVSPLISWLLWYLDSRDRDALGNDVLPQAAAAPAVAATPVTRAIPAVAASSAPPAAAAPSAIPATQAFPGEISAGDRNAAILPWRALALIAFAAFTANLACSYIMGFDYATVSVVSGGVVVSALVTVMSFALCLPQSDDISVGTVYRYILPLVIVGLLGILVFGQRGTTVGGALINGCGMFMQVLVIVKVAENTRRQGMSPLLSFSVGQGIIAGVVFVGNVLGKLLAAFAGTDQLVLSMLCGIGILVIFLMVIYTGSGFFDDEARETDDLPADKPVGAQVPRTTASPRVSEVQPVGTQAPRAAANPLTSEVQPVAAQVPAASAAQASGAPVDAPAERVEKLAASHDLTPREVEVLVWLARGRSLPYIAEQLFMTTGTVKTHTIHIYRKLGINTRQELLDMLDATR